MIKLIITDMDGTLLNDKHEIHEEFWGIYEKLKERGIHFVCASGRQYYNLLSKFDAIKNEIYFVAENGTYVMYKGQEVFSNEMPVKEARKLIEKARTISDSNIILCGKKGAYVESEKKEFIDEVIKYYDRYSVVKDLLEIEDDILKVTVCNLNGSEKNTYPHFIEDKKEFKVVVSGKIWLDITNLNANKGVAIKELQKILNVKSKETMAFGDYLNDSEMLEDAYYSYAMKDAHPELKKIARFIAGSNNENGVIEKIKEVIF